MALTQLTKVDGGGISTTSDYRVGIITASKFVGPFDGSGGNFSGVVTATNGVFSGNISAVDGNFSGNVTIGGTLTYEDVTNIDSVGIITAQKDIHVGAGVSAVGVGTFSGLDISGDIDVDGHTNLDNVSIAGVTTFAGAISASTLTASSSIAAASLTASSSYPTVTLNDTDSENDYQLRNANGTFAIHDLDASANRLTINSSGVIDFNGNVEANFDLDVDGHTNLDNVSIAGISTFSGIVDAVNTPASIRVAQDIQHKGDATTKISFPTNGEISFDTSGHDRIYIKSNGRIGMGTVTPANDIHHFSDGLNGNSFRLENREGYITLINDANGLYLDAEYFNFRNRAGSTSYASINTSGNFSVFYDLDVDGHTNLDNVSIAGITTFANNINVTGNIFTTKYIYHTNDTDTYFDFGTNTINLAAGGNIGLTILDSSVRVTDKLGINGAAPQTPLDVIANGSGYAINIRGRSSDNIGELRFTSNNYGALYGAITGGPTYLKFATGGTNRWYINSSGHFVPNSPGSYDIGSTSLEIGSIYLGVNKKVLCGLNQELELYTDGTDGYLKETNGDLYLQSTADDIIIRAADNISIQAQGGEYCINGNGNGSVDLYYDGGTYTTPKLSTTATGITVDGEVKASQEYPLTKPVLDFNFAAEKKLDPRIQFTRESIATFVDKKGIVRYSSENQPRFDHHPTSGVSLGLLLEKQSTNYQPYSVDMSQGANNNEVTIENNAAIAPDGTMTASKITGGTNQNTSQRLGWTTQGVASNSYTMWSIWLKSEETSCIIQIYSNTYTFGADVITVELADGTMGGHSGEFGDSTFRYNLEKYPNKWWRLSWGGNGNAGGNSGGMYVAVVPALNSARAANTGSAHSKVWYAWGLQEEVGTQRKFATSYIPTYGSAVTRASDRGTIDGDDFDDFFDRYQGAVVHETSNAIQSWTGGGSGWEFNNDNYQYNVITNIGSGYAHNAYPGGYAVAHGENSDTGTNSMSQFGPNTATGNQAFNNGYYAGRYPSNSNVDYNRLYKTYTDGMSWDVTGSTNTLTAAVGGFSSTGTNTNVISYRNISKLEFGSDAIDMDGSYQKFSGRIKRWMYYDKALTATQLENLTAQDPVTYL